MIKAKEVLEINKIKEKWMTYAYTESAKEKIRKMEVYLSESEVKSALRETSEAQCILEKMGNPPLTSFENMDEYLMAAEKGGCLLPEQLEEIAQTLTAVKRLKDFLYRTRYLEKGISYYDENLDSLEGIREEINRIIRGSRVDDYATKNLKDIRREIESINSKMREKADDILRKNKNYMSDQYTTLRNGRICVPVKKEYKLKISGSVIDQSATGNTLFIEPSVVAKYADELLYKVIEEENEVQKILYGLTAMVGDETEIVRQNQRTFEKLDYIFSKGKLSLSYEGIEPRITEQGMAYIF